MQCIYIVNTRMFRACQCSFALSLYFFFVQSRISEEMRVFARFAMTYDAELSRIQNPELSRHLKMSEHDFQL